MQDGQTPFLRAAAMNHVQVANFLLENGSSILERANVSDYQQNGRTGTGSSQINRFCMQYLLSESTVVLSM